MRRYHYGAQGFTLIEIIAVLVILGVLAATAIPYYFDLQRDADRKAAVAALAEAQARLRVRFGQLILQGKNCMEAAAQVNTITALADAEDGSFGAYLLSTEGKITQEGTLVFAKSVNSTADPESLGIKIYLPECGGSLSASNGMGGYDAFDFQHALLGALGSADINALGNNVDSTATGGNDAFLQKVKAFFEENGIDPSLSNIASWGYSQSGIMMWSETDISQSKPGDSVLVMRYNSKTGTYTVGTVTIQEKGTSSSTYNTFFTASGGAVGWKESTSAGTQTNKTSFESAMDYYKQVSTKK